jgi:hypothetical protein
MRHRTLLGLAVVVVASSCGGGGGGATGPGGAGARYSFKSQGTGPTNAKPLNPLRVGWVGGASTDLSIIDSGVTTGAGKELRMTNVFSGNVTRVLVDKDGLFFAGSTVDGVAPNPLLVVPATVRAGMKWDVFTEGSAPLYTYEVTQRAEVPDSIFGPGVQWDISRTGAGDPLTLRYLEGHGRTDLPAAVSWNDDPAFTAETAPAVELEPLVVPPSFGKRAWVETLSLVRSGTGPGLFIANDEAYGMAGNLGWCATYPGNGGPLAPVPPTMGPPYRKTAGPECVVTQYCAKVYNSAGAPSLDCTLSYASGQASGVVVGSDGQYTWLPRSNTGELAYGDTTRAGTDFSEVSYRGIAVVPDAEGKGNVLFSHFAGYGDLLALGDATNVLGDGSHPNLVPNNLLALADLRRVIPLGDDTGGRRTLLLQTADGMLWSAKLTGSTLSRPTRHVRLAGRLAVQATEHGNEILRVTGDGLVQRVRVDDQGLGLDPVADVTLPAGEQPHSAFLYREGADTFLVLGAIAPDGRDVDGPLVKLNLYRSKKPVTPGATIRPGGVNGVRAVTAGNNGDALVCWSGAGAPELTGWTIGGKPALSVAPVDVAGPCALVFRQPGRMYSEALDGASPYWTIEGPIPGQGRVTVRTSISPNIGLTTSTLPPALAPLTGGGFVSGRRIYGAGGVLLGVPTVLLDSEPDRNVTIDAAGNGLWVVVSDGIPADPRELRRVGLTSFKQTFDGADNFGIYFPSAGGGLVASVKGQPVYIAPDGAQTPLPPPGPNRTYNGRLADGTLCGAVIVGTTWNAFCRKPDGTEVMAELPPGLAGLGPMWPTDDGVFVMLVNEHYALDGATAKIIDYPEPHRGPMGFSFGADGSLWGTPTETINGGPTSVVRFTKAGMVPVKIPDGTFTATEYPVRVIVDEKVIIVVAQNGRMVTLARP